MEGMDCAKSSREKAWVSAKLHFYCRESVSQGFAAEGFDASRPDQLHNYGLESTLSGKGYVSRIQALKAAGYQIVIFCRARRGLEMA
ncbi:MAG: hypothetical protein ACOCVG_02750 [Verrucomicrobiota bacterium]